LPAGGGAGSGAALYLKVWSDVKMIFGILLVLIGLAALIWGGRKLNVREGPVLKLFTHRNVKLIQLAFAFAAFYLGIGLILGWFG